MNRMEPECSETAKAEAAVRQLLTFVGENPDRDGLHETPARVVKAYLELTAGQLIENPGELLKTFENDGTKEMVIVGSIPFHSLCEHHMLPFVGHAHIAYLPGARIVGLSKFARLVDAFARRLQVQERLTEQIANAIDETLKPNGVMVVVEAAHLCMSMRGVQRPGAMTITSAVRGAFKKQAETRAEALAHIDRNRP